MGCACNKNSTPPTGSTAARTAAAAAQQAAADAAARASNPSVSSIGPTAPLQGRTQSFALRTSDGRTQSFGSRLEAQAARLRTGGEILP